jgi:hypothetical protein
MPAWSLTVTVLVQVVIVFLHLISMYDMTPDKLNTCWVFDGETAWVLLI